MGHEVSATRNIGEPPPSKRRRSRASLRFLLHPFGNRTKRMENVTHRLFLLVISLLFCIQVVENYDKRGLDVFRKFRYRCHES